MRFLTKPIFYLHLIRKKIVFFDILEFNNRLIIIIILFLILYY